VRSPATLRARRNVRTRPKHKPSNAEVVV
jgi:hypothetical protein